MDNNNQEPNTRIERDDSFFDKISQGYLGIIIVLAPIALMVLGFFYKIYQILADKFPSAKVCILILTLSLYTTITYIVCYFIYKKHCGVPSNGTCLDCIETNVLDLMMMQYDLITSTRLEKIEREVQRGDEILIYTCSLGTEPYNVVKYNVKKKRIKYDILYYEGTFPPQKKGLYRTKTQLDQTRENTFDSKLAKSNNNNTGCGFDLFIIKRRNRHTENGITYEGYYAVNYSTDTKDCVKKARGLCPVDLQCDPENEKLFYHKIDEAVAKSIYIDLYKLRAKEPIGGGDK